MTPAADTLARTLFGEARGEGEKGMIAVACVIMNRVKKPGWWGNSVETVCRKPWQFSCWNTSDPNKPIIEHVTEADHQFALACHIAEQAVSGKLEDITHGATHYYDRRAHEPYWARGLKPVVEIGHHKFYVAA